MFLSHNVPVVYAALGNPETGATLQEILWRTNLNAAQIQKILDIFLTNGAVLYKDDKFFAVETDLDLNEMGQENGFRNSFAQSIEVLKKLALSSTPSDSRFFFYSAFSISNLRMPEFKRDLKDAILECIDKHQVETEEKVCRLNVGFHLGS